MTLNEITEQIIACSITVHRQLGPGLLESAYVHCLAYEMGKRDLFIEHQKPLPLIYNEVKLDCGYRSDLVVEQQVIVEVKSVEALNDLHAAQLLTYLKLSNCKLGLLINFNVVLLKDGIKRMLNKYHH
jgi:GxxExxY protein